MRNTTRAIISNLSHRYPALTACEASMEIAVEALLTCFEQGGKLLVCGNGGSASDSEHIVGELMKTFMLERPLDETMCEKIRTAYPDQADKMIANLQRAVPAMDGPAIFCWPSRLPAIPATSSMPHESHR